MYPDTGKVSLFSGYFGLTTTTSTMFVNWMLIVLNYVGAYFLPNNFLISKYVYISAYCFSNATFCSSTFATLQTNCYSSCSLSLDIYDHYYDYISTRIMSTSGVAYLSSTALNSTNIVDGLNEITNFIISNNFTGCSGNSVLGGVSSRIYLYQNSTLVSIQMRTSLMAITCFSALSDTSSSFERQYQVSLMDYLAENIFKKYSNCVYWNEAQHNFPNNDWQERYWGGLANYNRLVTVKQQYDQDNFFSCYHCIGYVRVENEDPTVCPTVSCTCSNNPNGVCNKAYIIGFQFMIMCYCSAILFFNLVI